MIKTAALGLLLSLSLSSAAQRKSQLCRIASGPLAGLLEQVESTGLVGSPCTDHAGNRGVYISPDEQTKTHAPAPRGSIGEDSDKDSVGSASPSRGVPAPSQDSTDARQPVPSPPPPAATAAPAKPLSNEIRSSPEQAHKRVDRPGSPATTASSPATPAQQVHLWFERLPEGSVRYHVPTDMVLDESYSATAELHPPGNAKAPES